MRRLKHSLRHDTKEWSFSNHSCGTWSLHACKEGKTEGAGYVVTTIASVKEQGYSTSQSISPDRRAAAGMNRNTVAAGIMPTS